MWTFFIQMRSVHQLGKIWTRHIDIMIQLSNMVTLMYSHKRIRSQDSKKNILTQPLEISMFPITKLVLSFTEKT